MNELKVYEVLDKLNIKYKKQTHKAVFTCMEADVLITDFKGVKSKSLFLTNKKKNYYYLVIMDSIKNLNMDELANKLNESRLSFASPERLDKELGLESGYVSIFGLLNNTSKNITVIFDKDIIDEELITFNPNINTATIEISMKDMFAFINYINFEYIILKL